VPHGKSVKVERPLTFTNGTNDLDRFARYV